MAAPERSSFQRERILFYSGAVAGGSTLQTALGLAAAPGFHVHGHRRLRGYLSTTVAPAAGFPRIRFGSDGTNIDEVFVLVQDPAQSNFQYPFDIPVFGDYTTGPELTNGAGAATVRVECWADPEGSGPPILGGVNPTPPKPAVLTALGFQQLTAITNAATQTLTVPAGANYAYIQAETAAVRWRDDGVAPTSAIGNIFPVGGQPFFYQGGNAGLTALTVISSGANATLDVTFYK